MRKIFSLLFILILLFSVASCAVMKEAGNSLGSQEEDISGEQSEGTKEETKEEITTMPAPLTKEINSINLTIDPRLELLTIVQYLSEYSETYTYFVKGSYFYTRDIEEYFKDYLDHDLIKYINKNISSGFGYDLPPTVILHLNDDFTVSSEAVISEVSSRTSGFSLDEFTSLFKKFYIDTNFETFFKNHKEYYDTILENTVEKIPHENVIENLEKFYKETDDNYYIYLASIYRGVGFGGEVQDEKRNVYAVFGSGAVEGGLPVFGSKEGFKDLLYHEFGHSFIHISDQEVSDSTRKAIEKTEFLLDPIKTKMENMAYGNWGTTFEELVLRATNIKIYELTSESDYSPTKESALKYEMKNGFIYIETIFDSLDEYVNNIDEYETFDEFIPKIAEYLILHHPKEN